MRPPAWSAMLFARDWCSPETGVCQGFSHIALRDCSDVSSSVHLRFETSAELKALPARAWCGRLAMCFLVVGFPYLHEVQRHSEYLIS